MWGLKNSQKKQEIGKKTPENTPDEPETPESEEDQHHHSEEHNPDQNAPEDKDQSKYKPRWHFVINTIVRVGICIWIILGVLMIIYAPEIEQARAKKAEEEARLEKKAAAIRSLYGEQAEEAANVGHSSTPQQNLRYLKKARDAKTADNAKNTGGGKNTGTTSLSSTGAHSPDQVRVFTGKGGGSLKAGKYSSKTGGGDQSHKQSTAYIEGNIKETPALKERKAKKGPAAIGGKNLPTSKAAGGGRVESSNGPKDGDNSMIPQLNLLEFDSN